MFIMSLAIADLTVGVIVMPISAAYAITGKIKKLCFHYIRNMFYILLQGEAYVFLQFCEAV